MKIASQRKRDWANRNNQAGVLRQLEQVIAELRGRGLKVELRPMNVVRFGPGIKADQFLDLQHQYPELCRVTCQVSI